MTSWKGAKCGNCGKAASTMLKCKNCGTLGCKICVGSSGKSYCKTCRKTTEKLKV
jgi:hypothetical protein